MAFCDRWDWESWLLWKYFDRTVQVERPYDYMQNAMSCRCHHWSLLSVVLSNVLFGARGSGDIVSHVALVVRSCRGAGHVRIAAGFSCIARKLC